mmetsp:Transcript_120538/g.239953  ORF Transcript_120538/g.239953 Transcript_120538/m.239953 type:complete len:210 (+) Transcript_120538:859-1488(+)
MLPGPAWHHRTQHSLPRRCWLVLRPQPFPLVAATPLPVHAPSWLPGGLLPPRGEALQLLAGPFQLDAAILQLLAGPPQLADASLAPPPPHDGTPAAGTHTGQHQLLLLQSQSKSGCIPLYPPQAWAHLWIGVGPNPAACGFAALQRSVESAPTLQKETPGQPTMLHGLEASCGTLDRWAGLPRNRNRQVLRQPGTTPVAPTTTALCLGH